MTPEERAKTVYERLGSPDLYCDDDVALIADAIRAAMIETRAKCAKVAAGTFRRSARQAIADEIMEMEL